MSVLKKIEKTINNGLYKLLQVFFRNKRVDSCDDLENLKKVLFLRYDVLGDMICTYPAMKYLNSELPNVKIDVLASESNSFLIKNDETFNSIYHFNGKILSNIKYLLQIRKNNYDVIFATYYVNLTKNGILSNILGNSNTIKANVYDKEKRYLFFNFQSKIAQSKSNMFEKMYYLVADYIGKSNELGSISLSIPRKEESLSNVEDYLDRNEIEKFIVINLSSGKENRKWSTEKLILLINQIQAKNIQLSFIITAMSKDKQDAVKIVNETKGSLYFGESSIFEMIELIDKAEVVLTPDTSVVHICSVTNTKVCVFTFQNIVDECVWTPYKVSNRLMIANPNDEMRDIPVEKVLSSVQELLSE